MSARFWSDTSGPNMGMPRPRNTPSFTTALNRSGLYTDAEYRRSGTSPGLIAQLPWHRVQRAVNAALPESICAALAVSGGGFRGGFSVMGTGGIVNFPFSLNATTRGRLLGMWL